MLSVKVNKLKFLSVLVKFDNLESSRHWKLILRRVPHMSFTRSKNQDDDQCIHVT